MKVKPIISLLVVFTLFSIQRISAQIEHLEPPFWWTGMKNPDLQLMAHGKDISENKVYLDYDGVRIKSVSSVENPNYLFIDLELAPNVKPGTFNLRFLKNGEVTYTYGYELKERENGSADREGFNNSDVLYLIMPDRFSNGDPNNDEVEGMKEGLNRKDTYGRHGGDIKGIIDHLDYIEDMGFTSIWLNPVLENDQPQWSYHGYATTDFYQVDRRFGTNEEYRFLGLKAKEKGIKLVMDMIFNHCGSEHWWMNDLPSSDWLSINEFKRTNHRRTVNHDPHVSEFDKKAMVDGWFVPTMPDLNQNNPFMANYLIQNSIWWIEYLGLAGIRMDTYPYPEKYMMAEWNRQVLKEYPDLNLVGEEWSLNPVIVSYWQKGQTNQDGYEGEIPSMLDFPLQGAVHKALTVEESFTTGWVTLYDMLASDILYPDPNNLVIFPDNHDMSRFYMQVGMDDALYKIGITCFLTTRGIPQIFYGSEILMSHKEGNDHGNIRKDFPGGWKGDKINGFTGEELADNEREMQKFFRDLLNWRKETAVMHNGKLMHFAPENGIYVYFRYDDTQKVMIILNKNKDEIELKLERFSEMLEGITNGIDVLTGKTVNLTNALMIQAMSPLILELK